MFGLDYRCLFVLAGCGPIVPVDDTTAADPCIDRHASIEVLTITSEGHPVVAEVYYQVGDDPRTAAHFDGHVHAIWGVARERTTIFATDGVCRFETEAIGASGCTDDAPVHLEFVFDRFCGEPPSTTGSAPMPEDETSSTGGGWGSSYGSESSSTSDGPAPESSEGTTSSTGEVTTTGSATDDPTGTSTTTTG